MNKEIETQIENKYLQEFLGGWVIQVQYKNLL